MITFFTTAKPFRGHNAVIQRNALQSWKCLHPDVEVILFGNEEGAAKVSSELGLVHEPEIERSRLGGPLAAYMFQRAQEIARYDLLCYSNCDILLLQDFRQALERLRRWHPTFLMAGRRWDVDIREALDFNRRNWRTEVRDLALRCSQQRPAQFIDYFAFRKGLFHQRIPEFVIGRAGWDNWLLWQARSSGAWVVDASSVVCAVHQNHDYGHHPDGKKGVYKGEEAQHNLVLLEGHRKFHTLENATHLLHPDGIHRNYRHWLVQLKRNSFDYLSPVWFRLLELTRPVRHLIGLRQTVGKDDTETPKNIQ